MSNLDLGYMRASGNILAETLQHACTNIITEGISTLEISNQVESFILNKKGFPAFKDYNGFPFSACISINTEAVHALPSKDKVIKSGDIVSIDCGVVLNGHFTDACRTIQIGQVPESTIKLIKFTKQSLDEGILKALPGNKVGDISYAIQKKLNRGNLKPHLTYVGHGIGLNLHQYPAVPNYGPSNTGPILKEGMCLAIEPVAFLGKTDTKVLNDRWTVESTLGVLSAHFEDTLIITKEGPEVITRIK